MTEPTIYLTDQVVLAPGAGRGFVDAYLAEYAPGAASRGLVLDRVLVHPPLWLDDDSNTVTAVWTVEGTANWWRAAIAGRHDPEPGDWWRRFEDVIVSRTRSISAAADDVDRLNHV